MGNSINQYRAAIGRWHGGGRPARRKTEYSVGQQMGLSSIMMAAAVMAVLLVIGGVEMNPGPGPAGTVGWEEMEKIREIVKEACQAEQTSGHFKPWIVDIAISLIRLSYVDT